MFRILDKLSKLDGNNLRYDGYSHSMKLSRNDILILDLSDYGNCGFYLRIELQDSSYDLDVDKIIRDKEINNLDDFEKLLIYGKRYSDDFILDNFDEEYKSKILEEILIFLDGIN